MHSLSLHLNAAILKHRSILRGYEKCNCTHICTHKHTRKTVDVDLYTLTGRESRLSAARAIGNNVLQPAGNTSVNYLYTKGSYLSVPHAEKYLQGCTRSRRHVRKTSFSQAISHGLLDQNLSHPKPQTASSIRYWTSPFRCRRVQPPHPFFDPDEPAIELLTNQCH